MSRLRLRLTKKVNGKTYRLHSEAISKKNAKSTALNIRKHGFKAIVVKAPKSDYFNHRVYIRKVK